MPAGSGVSAVGRLLDLSPPSSYKQWVVETPTHFSLVARLLLPQDAPVWMQWALSLGAIATIYLPMAGLMALMFIWAERKVSGRIQSRHGPNRVGWIGLLQSIADGIKLIAKEDLCPAGADRALFRLAPYIAFVPVFVAFVAIPFGPDLVFEPAMYAGVVWILAVLSIEVVGVILAGWSSNSKWSIYGAMREACQMVSYEVPLGLSIIVGVMAAGTLNLVTIGHIQGGGIHTWLMMSSPAAALALLMYFICSLASNKRAPFDLPESESELVAGYHTEYSGLRFSFFYFAEYLGMFIVSAVQVGLFLGAWHDPFGLLGYYHHKFVTESNDLAVLAVNLVAGAIFMSKCLLLVFLQMWVRWTLPRPRIDQVLHLCFKVMLPATLAILVLCAVWMLLVAPRPGMPWVDFNPWLIDAWSGHRLDLLWRTLACAAAGLATLTICVYVLAAFSNARKVRPRLSIAEPIAISPPMAP